MIAKGDVRAGSDECAPTVGVVLAGGRSRRLGRDKARLLWRGVSLAAHAVDRLRRLGLEVLVADRGRGLVPGAVSCTDGPGAGPAAGILGAAAQRPDCALLVVACDLPLVPAAVLQQLRDAGPADWVVPRHARGIEPLCACFRPAALHQLARRVAADRLAVHGLASIPALTVRYLEGAALGDDPSRAFLNVNRPQDLERLMAIAAAGAPGRRALPGDRARG